MATPGGLALINAVSGGAVKLATDQGTLATLQASVTAQIAVIANDTTGNTQANAALSAFLQANGAEFVTNSDGSESVYEYATTDPGFTIVPAQPAT